MIHGNNPPTGLGDSPEDDGWTEYDARQAFGPSIRGLATDGIRMCDLADCNRKWW